MRNKRASFSTLVTAAAAAASMVAGAFSSSAQAIFVYDVRAVSVTGAGNSIFNNKQVQMPSAGVVTFQLWGIIQAPYGSGNPEDGNPNNEANKVMIGSFLTSGTSISGALSATVVPSMQNLGFSTGTVQDLDGDGDLDVGSNVSTSASDYWAARTTDVTNGLPGQQSLLGTMTLTVGPGGSHIGDFTPTLVNFRKKTGAPNSVGSWNENGLTVLSNTSNVLSGAPVSIQPFFDPEPASTGLITVIGLTSLARRKSRRLRNNA